MGRSMTLSKPLLRCSFSSNTLSINSSYWLLENKAFKGVFWWYSEVNKRLAASPAISAIAPGIFSSTTFLWMTLLTWSALTNWLKGSCLIQSNKNPDSFLNKFLWIVLWKLYCLQWISVAHWMLLFVALYVLLLIEDSESSLLCNRIYAP